VDVWVPLDDLLDACFPARRLTIYVEQRLYALRNEYGGYSPELNEAIKEASFAAKGQGTESVAILGWLEEWIWGAEERLRRQQAEARLRSGDDGPWTVATGTVDTHWRAKR
jgi:hypothetical protein